MRKSPGPAPSNSQAKPAASAEPSATHCFFLTGRSRSDSPRPTAPHVTAVGFNPPTADVSAPQRIVSVKTQDRVVELWCDRRHSGREASSWDDGVRVSAREGRGNPRFAIAPLWFVALECQCQCLHLRLKAPPHPHL